MSKIKGIDAKFVGYKNGQRPVNSDDLVDVTYLGSVPDPADIEVNNWGNLSLRYMLDPISGDDSYDGKTWATAKKTLQAVIDIIPTELGVLDVLILTMSGSCGGGTFKFRGGKIHVMKLMSDVVEPYYTNGESIVFNDDPLIVDGDIIAMAGTLLQFAGQSLAGLPYGSIQFELSGFFGILIQQEAFVELQGCEVTASGTYILFANGNGVWIGGCSIKGDIIIGDQNKLFSFDGDFTADPLYPKPFAGRNAVNDDVLLKGFNKAVNSGLNIDVALITVTSGSFTINGDNLGVGAVGGDIGTTFVGSNPSFHCGNQAMLRNLPIADPTIAGALWSNAGVVTVSAG